MFTKIKDKVEKILLRWLKKAMPYETRKTVTVTDWVMSQVARVIRVRRDVSGGDGQEG